jgi:hypothetical protein
MGVRVWGLFLGEEERRLCLGLVWSGDSLGLGEDLAENYKPKRKWEENHLPP